MGPPEREIGGAAPHDRRDPLPARRLPLEHLSLNIRTGYRDIAQQTNDDIVILVSSLPKVEQEGRPFVFTDRHAVLETAVFYSDLGELTQIDWDLLQRRDFRRDPDDPGKPERYQAEALVHRHLPASDLLGVCCYNEDVRRSVAAQAESCGLDLKVIQRRTWYFQ